MPFGLDDFLEIGKGASSPGSFALSTLTARQLLQFACGVAQTNNTGLFFRLFAYLVKLCDNEKLTIDIKHVYSLFSSVCLGNNTEMITYVLHHLRELYEMNEGHYAGLFCLAFECGCQNAVSLLLTFGYEFPNYEDDVTELVEYGLCNNQPHLVTWACDTGLIDASKIKADWSHFGAAAYIHSRDMVEMLIKSGGNLKEYDDVAANAFQTDGLYVDFPYRGIFGECADKDVKSHVVKSFLAFLFEHGARVTLSTMHAALFHGDVGIVEWIDTLAEEGVDLFDDESCVYASQSGNVEMVQWVLDKEECNADVERMANGAARSGRIEVLNWMHENESMFETSVFTSETMHNAVSGKQFDTVKYLWEHGCPLYEHIITSVIGMKHCFDAECTGIERKDRLELALWLHARGAEFPDHAFDYAGAWKDVDYLKLLTTYGMQNSRPGIELNADFARNVSIMSNDFVGSGYVMSLLSDPNPPSERLKDFDFLLEEE